jgi:L-alanine-DL-glutamate epimerase-like enolase superfamily enzyme
MKVTEVKAIVLSYKYDHAFADACAYFSNRNAVLVQIETDEGIVGIGESACFGGPPFSTATLIERELSRYVLGQDPMDVEKIMRQIWWEHASTGAVALRRRRSAA